MEFAFDLISDLHIETWPGFDWSNQATSPYCVVAGDVARDRKVLIETLKHLGRCYQGVFYIDGNDEHKNHYHELGQSYKDLSRYVDKIKNVVFMQDNVVIVNGVALLASNGWWSFDFDPTVDTEQSIAWFCNHYRVDPATAVAVTSLAINDATYMVNSVKKLQTHRDVKKIVMISHTVPSPWLVSHDIELQDTYRSNCIGNNHLGFAIDQDTEHKISHWVFGHYHKPVDREANGIRWVNNCRGRGDTPWQQEVYYPKRIVVEV
jgi:hypothetical protein